jgi:hypothetical protein
MSQTESQLIDRWKVHAEQIKRSTPVDNAETDKQKAERIAALLADWEKFCKYYFPRYCNAPFGRFHKRYFKRVLKNKRIYITRAWARSHSKSITTAMLLLYLKFTGQMHNLLMVSKSLDNAIDLLNPIRINLEVNERLINDFGIQKIPGNIWSAEKFITHDKCTFRALGRGQSPRGAKEEEVRPDTIVCDDLDDDELVRSPNQLDKAWDWTMGALFGCFDIEGDKRFIMLNNIIGKDSLMQRASKVADHHEQINIYDKDGNPSWHERFTKDDCEYMIQKMGYRLSQREYFNNPLVEGKVFKKKWFQYKKLPPLSSYQFLVAYNDPGFKNTSTADSKALVLVGLHKAEYHVHKVFCNSESLRSMIGWHYEMDTWIKGRNGSCVFWMEQVFLQDLLFKDFNEAAKEVGYSLPVLGDTRKKPNKDLRIESTSGFFERGSVYFNIEEKDNHHMVHLIEQYMNFQTGASSLKDGPDAMEGAFHKLQESVVASEDLTIGRRIKSTRYSW